ncbi:tRNA lysidine(34) synthetase [Desulfoplanes formicivorans]|uniref:Arginosuccinate synthase n=1 Tax=Desulfoplanes formicivorans TaxID=1592317 RepID=A0A194AG38_9BACT|nr:tRNA 2-thiocytidine biosynthesis TtcA family protein [Desulfoplanes formicivorans]GAU09042.1 arginosuccinate synthase [Desulfoplanes formicivorans]
MLKRRNLTFAQRSCIGKSGKIIQQTGMLHQGARVGVAVSGGKDSWVMLQALRMRQKILPYPFEIMALHLNPGFDPRDHAPLHQWLAKHNIPAHIELTDYGPRAHSPENRKKSPCFFCSWFRRKHLFDLCRRYRLTHLALGHTSDDLVQTFFMNLFKTGKVAGLSPREQYFDGRLVLIRPMLLLDEKTIATAARQWKFPITTTSCPSAGTTQRSRTGEWLKELTRKDPTLKKNIFNGLRRWQLDETAKFS